MNIESIAIICHEANRLFCIANGDLTQPQWDEAPLWQKESALKGVQFRLNNPDAPASAQHDSWMADKLSNGWVYGPVKDTVRKTHPCLVPFHELPEFQQKKDRLFQNIVDALK